MTNRTMWILATIWMTFLAILMLSGCKTKTVTEFIAVHDTLRIHKIDTLTVYQGKEVHDTTREVIEKIITIKESGDTLCINVYKDRYRNVYVHDTIDRYKAKYDSLLAIKHEQHDTVVIKKESWWRLWKWKLIAAASLFAVIFVLWKCFKGTIKKWLKR